MTVRLKYVMFRVSHPGGATQYFPIMFSEAQVHREVSDAVSLMKIGLPHRWVRPEPVSAGFVVLGDGEAVRCFGGSESLDLPAHVDDPEIIRSMSYSMGLGFPDRKAGEG